MSIISSIYLFLLVLQDNIPKPFPKAWERLFADCKYILSLALRKTREYALWFNRLYSQCGRSLIAMWLLPFAVAVLIAVVALYILQFLRKELEMPHREIIQTKAFLPSWTKMKEIEGHHLTPSMQEPTLQLEREMQIVELLVLLNLYESAMKGDDFVLKQLAELHAIDRIPNINQTFDFKFDPGRSTTQATTLMIASKNGYASVVELLLLHPDIDVNATAPEFGSTALMWACHQGHLLVVKRLLAMPNIAYNHQGKLGWTAFIGACTNSYVEVVAELLKLPDIDVNAADDEGFTGLIWAVSNNNAAIVQLLLQHPTTNVNIATNFGVTAYRLAQIKGHKKILMMLRKSGRLNDDK